MSDIEYDTSAWGEVKADIYAGEPCGSKHEKYIEMSCRDDMGSVNEKDIIICSSIWPVGTKISIEIPLCPECETDAKLQDKAGKCECGFDWKTWAEEQYS
ncbi:hypothetical protein N473_26215 [Pseudoalteromonas luteoviolacea CPMOR-1]|uniref:Uncharacterized protein n=1 Tax=Pseudoalteromonas luteoviolacea CPMOR-1 TaxID=1365248 RepID=A0A167I5C3_9GAMM|nr:hypothetical protein [Pseudoalteromonas luteoviolacea]KZN58914.1 hypothetical protein N473_26215 [Pseudoalteromonas luteoviolacea CPMOR-1]